MNSLESIVSISGINVGAPDLELGGGGGIGGAEGPDWPLSSEVLISKLEEMSTSTAVMVSLLPDGD